MNVSRAPNYSKVVASVVFSMLFGLISTSAINFFIRNFLFSMFLGSILTLTSYVLLILKFNLSLYGKFMVFQQGLCVSMAVFLFLFAVPLNVDRSISVWLLSRTINSRQLSEAELQREAVYFFESSNSEVKRRVNEQVHLKNLEVNNSSKYQATKQGKLLVKFFRFVAVFFNLHERYANGS